MIPVYTKNACGFCDVLKCPQIPVKQTADYELYNLKILAFFSMIFRITGLSGFHRVRKAALFFFSF